MEAAVVRSTWTDERLDAFREHVDARFDAVDRRFEAVDQRFNEVDRRFEVVDHRFDEVDRRLDYLVTEAHRQTERIDGLHRLLVISAGAVIAVLGTTSAALIGLFATQV